MSVDFKGQRAEGWKTYLATRNGITTSRAEQTWLQGLRGGSKKKRTGSVQRQPPVVVQGRKYELQERPPTPPRWAFSPRVPKGKWGAIGRYEHRGRIKQLAKKKTPQPPARRDGPARPYSAPFPRSGARVTPWDMVHVGSMAKGYVMETQKGAKESEVRAELLASERTDEEIAIAMERLRIEEAKKVKMDAAPSHPCSVHCSMEEVYEQIGAAERQTERVEEALLKLQEASTLEKSIALARRALAQAKDVLEGAEARGF